MAPEAMLETRILVKRSSSNRLGYYKIERLYVQIHNWVYAHAKIASSLDRTGSCVVWDLMEKEGRRDDIVMASYHVGATQTPGNSMDNFVCSSYLFGNWVIWARVTLEMLRWEYIHTRLFWYVRYRLNGKGRYRVSSIKFQYWSSDVVFLHMAVRLGSRFLQVLMLTIGIWNESSCQSSRDESIKTGEIWKQQSRKSYRKDHKNQASGSPLLGSCGWPFHPIYGHPWGSDENGGSA